MPPRKSKRLLKPQKEEQEHEEIGDIVIENHQSDNEMDRVPVEYSTEYFEFNDTDLKVDEKQKEFNVSTEVETTSSPIQTGKTINKTQQTLSRKIKLLLRKTHLICDIKASQFFIRYHLRNQELLAFTLSGLPPHILRIFDPIMISEGKSLKNSLAMLVIWWKNNIGSRMISGKIDTLRMHSRRKILELKSSFFSKSVYEDDSVRLFSIACHGLGIRIRFVHSLDPVLASTSSVNGKSTSTKFQYVPQYWIEIYSSLDERWIPIDCIQGLVDEKARLENKLKPHCFVIAVDFDGHIFDLTEKYSSDYHVRSFKLRKDEDKWLKELITKMNSENILSTKLLLDRDQIDTNAVQNDLIEIPKTLVAMKSHPTLILASQLRKYEVFYPVTEPVGVFKDESVFLRENVKKVRSKDAWLSQCARTVKVTAVYCFYRL